MRRGKVRGESEFLGMKRVNFISLGCSKNLVDTELLMKQFELAGYKVYADSDNPKADVVVINTCGFIGDAKEESVNTILEQVALKEQGVVKKIFVMGCLSQRYKDELLVEIPEVDGYYGKFDWTGIIEALNHTYNVECRNSRMLTTPSHYAYVKISEGCNRKCSYCAIPMMTGEHKSRPMEEIVEECKELAANGVKELLVMAQDLTYYGIDLYGKNRLADLINALADIQGIEWIKLHYAYPAGFPMEILKVMRERSNVCKYLDIALQHCSDNMLAKMRRGVTKAGLEELLTKIRQEVPGIAIRTTLMTGHPGETTQDYLELKAFVKSQKFERLGVFPYSHEEGTYCDKNYTDDVPTVTKKRRAATIMDIQRKLSLTRNEGLIGQTFKVIIDKKEGEYWVGRTEYDSPEVDPEVLIKSRKRLEIGGFYEVLITGADEYDLYGEMR